MDWTLVVSAVVAYLLGAIPFGYLFVRYAMGKDIRTMGSGNIGATNVHRTAGRGAEGVVDAGSGHRQRLSGALDRRAASRTMLLWAWRYRRSP